MQIISARVPRSRTLAGAGVELSRAAQQRLRWITHYQSRSRNVALTCRYFGISRQTFYRWGRRYQPDTLTTLEERSHRPHRRRQPTWTPQPAEQVRQLRQQYPRWGKDKLVVRRRDRWRVSTSMVGRILTHLKGRGLRLFLLPPRSPQLNGAVERAQRTPTEEFYEVTQFSLEMAALNRELRAWEEVYNTVRPHQALGYLTPQPFLAQWQSQPKEAECH